MGSSCSQSAEAESEPNAAGDATSPAPESAPAADIAAGGSASQKQTTIDGLVAKRDAAARLKSRYQSQLRGLTASGSVANLADAVAGGGSKADADAALAKPAEAVFSAPIAALVTEDRIRRADRSRVFPGLRGLHSAYDKAKRIDLKLVVTEQTYSVETLTDIHSGESVRASMDDVGPRRSKLTWDAIATVIQLVVGFGIEHGQDPCADTRLF